MNIMDFNPKHYIRKHKLTQWFVVLNILGLAGVFVWPLVFFGSIFMFDHPENFIATFILFLLINSYPLLYIGNLILSVRLFHSRKTIAIILPIIGFLSFVFVFLYIALFSGG